MRAFGRILCGIAVYLALLAPTLAQQAPDGYPWTGRGRGAQPTWGGSVYFNNGFPTCDVRSQGAKGNFSNDDAPAFRKCKQILDSIPGSASAGRIYVPPGIYCMKSADPDDPSGHSALYLQQGISITGSTIDGTHGGTAIWACATDLTMIYANSSLSKFENLNIYGHGGGGYPGGTFGATYPAFVVGPNCVGCILDNVRVAGGAPALLTQAADVNIHDSLFQAAYSGAYGAGNAIVYGVNNAVAVHWDRSTIDQNAPNGALAYGTSILGWACGTAASATAPGTVVQTQGYYIQATATTSDNLTSACTAGFTSTISGTSMVVSVVSVGSLALGNTITGSGVSADTRITGCPGGGCGSAGTYTINNSQTVSSPTSMTAGTAPTLANFGINITDNHVTWQLFAPVSLVGLMLETGAEEIDLARSDFSCAVCTYGISMENFLSGSAGVGYLHISSGSVLSATLSSNLQLYAGSNVTVSGSHLLGCVFTQCTNIATASGFGSDLIIDGNIIGNGYNGVFVSNSNNQHAVIANNIFFGSPMTNAVLIGANVSYFTVEGNDCTNVITYCAFITTGTSDHYKIFGNIMGATTVSDSGSGTHKVVETSEVSLQYGVSSGTGGSAVVGLEGVVSINGASTLAGQLNVKGGNGTVVGYFEGVSSVPLYITLRDLSAGHGTFFDTQVLNASSAVVDGAILQNQGLQFWDTGWTQPDIEWAGNYGGNPSVGLVQLHTGCWYNNGSPHNTTNNCNVIDEPAAFAPGYDGIPPTATISSISNNGGLIQLNLSATPFSPTCPTFVFAPNQTSGCLVPGGTGIIKITGVTGGSGATGAAALNGTSWHYTAASTTATAVTLTGSTYGGTPGTGGTATELTAPPMDLGQNAAGFDIRRWANGWFSTSVHIGETTLGPAVAALAIITGTNDALGIFGHFSDSSGSVISSLNAAFSVLQPMEFRAGPGTFSATYPYLFSGGGISVVNGANGFSLVTGNSTTGQSMGLAINAGTNSSDTALTVQSQNASTQYFKIYGDGGAVFGNPSGGDLGSGNVNIQTKVRVGGNVTTPGSGLGEVGATSTNGLTLIGHGGSNDINILNSAGNPVCSVPTGTTTLACVSVTGTNLRTVLTGNLTLYVDPSCYAGGCSSNNCTASGTPCTIQQAYNILVTNYDTAGHNVTFSGAHGNYNPTSTSPCLSIAAPWVGGGNLTIDLTLTSGPSSTCNTTSSDAFDITSPIPGILILKDFTCTTTTAGSCISVTAPGAAVQYSNSFGSIAYWDVNVASSGSSISCAGNYSITGTHGLGHWNATQGSAINCGNVAAGYTITLSMSPVFTVEFAQASQGAVISVPIGTAGSGLTHFSGTAGGGGKQYNVVSNGLIDTGGSCVSLPGSGTGVATQGQCI